VLANRCIVMNPILAKEQEISGSDEIAYGINRMHYAVTRYAMGGRSATVPAPVPAG